MPEISTKPYLLRAIYEWCTDNGYTPYLSVVVDQHTRVPLQFVKNGEIVLNISFTATSGLKMENDFVHFNARFGGISREIVVPVENVAAIYARENGQGMAFEVNLASAEENEAAQEEGTEGRSPATADGPMLSAVPNEEKISPDVGSGDEPQPPKKGGRPTLTRIK